MPFSALLFSIICLAVSGKGQAASFPGESLMRPQSGLFWTSQGFRLGTEGTAWRPLVEASDIREIRQSAKTPLESLTYVNSSLGENARLRVDVESLKGRSNLETYSKRWVKEYPHYGMRVISSKPTRVNNHPTVVYDLLSKSQDVQIRQTIQVYRGKAVIMTCSDAAANFQKTAEACNKMAQNLIWSEIKTK